jgi:hypothetical protein
MEIKAPLTRRTGTRGRPARSLRAPPCYAFGPQDGQAARLRPASAPGQRRPWKREAPRLACDQVEPWGISVTPSGSRPPIRSSQHRRVAAGRARTDVLAGRARSGKPDRPDRAAWSRGRVTAFRSLPAAHPRGVPHPARGRQRRSRRCQRRLDGRPRARARTVEDCATGSPLTRASR